MNDRQLENKICQDAANVIKDVSTLAGDSAARFGRFENDVSQATGKAKVDLTTWVDENISQMSKEFEKLTGDARDTLVNAAATAKKDVGHGLSQYNTKIQEVADRVPGDFAKKAAGFPWVTITISLAAGFLLGVLLKPSRQSVG